MAWNPNASGGSFSYVYALSVSEDVVYAGGDFTMIRRAVEELYRGVGLKRKRAELEPGRE